MVSKGMYQNYLGPKKEPKSQYVFFYSKKVKM